MTPEQQERLQKALASGATLHLSTDLYETFTEVTRDELGIPLAHFPKVIHDKTLKPGQLVIVSGKEIFFGQSDVACLD